MKSLMEIYTLQIKLLLVWSQEMRAKLLFMHSSMEQVQKKSVVSLEVRKEMVKFISFNKNKKIAFFEIPLLVESKLMSFFDVIILIRAKKKIRAKRFVAKGGQKEIFELLNKKQIPDSEKTKFCDHQVVNEKNFNILKKRLLDIIKLYV